FPSHFDGNQIAVTIPRGKDGTDRTLTDGNTGRAGTAAGAIFGANGAGLGFDGAGNKIGGYAASIGEWTADGTRVAGAVAPGGTGEVQYGWAALPRSSVYENGGPLPNGVTYVFTQTENDPSTIVTAQNYSVGLSVVANIAPAKTLTLDRPVRLDGSMLFTLNYL
ncbi:hypothetical protein, partial [Burkholderia ubonensis]|uniref:hypothetical protein n=1 Tax=Burkholderia ubonensis TaxID=101571 RepID=UPI0039F5D4D1